MTDTVGTTPPPNVKAAKMRIYERICAVLNRFQWEFKAEARDVSRGTYSF